MRKDDKTRVAMLMPATAAAFVTLTKAERENVLSRARLELFKLTVEVNGDEHARLEMDLNAWISADRTRVEMFWRQPERTVRQALHIHLTAAMGELGLDIARLSGN